MTSVHLQCMMLNLQTGLKWNKLSFKDFPGFHSKSGRIYNIQIMDILTSLKKWEMKWSVCTKTGELCREVQVHTKFSSKSPNKKYNNNNKKKNELNKNKNVKV